MIKLFIFESVEDARIFEDSAKSQSVAKVSPPPIPQESPADAPKRRYKKRKVNPEREAMKERLLEKARTRKARVLICKNCGKPGHFAKTCPEGKPAEAAVEDDGVLDEDMKEKVATMREEGKTSGAIAKELGVSLKTVNKYW
jgi:hypothetical protein